LDGITAVIITTVSLAIIYYVTVLGTEISILGTAHMRERGAMSKSGRGAKFLSSGPPAAEFDPGVVSAQLNPQFLQTKMAAEAKEDTADLGKLLASIQSMREPPPVEVWGKFQKSLSELKGIVEESENQLKGLLSEVKEAEVDAVADAASKTLARTGRRRVEKNEIASAATIKGKRDGGGGVSPGGSPGPSSGGLSPSTNPLLAGGRLSIARASLASTGGGTSAGEGSPGLRGLGSFRARGPSLSAGGGGLEMTSKSKLGDNGEEDAATSSPNPLHGLKGYASRGISKKADV